MRRAILVGCVLSSLTTYACCFAAGQNDEQSTAAPIFVQYIEDPDADLGSRAHFVFVYSDMRAKLPIVVPKLIEWLDDEDPRFRTAVATALGEMGPAAKEAAARLEDLSKDADFNVRWAAAEAFHAVGGR